MERKPVKVVIGTPCFSGVVDIEVAGRIAMYMKNLAKSNPEIDIEWVVIKRQFVNTARNNIVMVANEVKADYVWWVDDDCVLPPYSQLNILPRLIDHDKDIVIVPYFLRKPPHDCGVLRAADYKRGETYYNLVTDDLNKGLIEVDGGGTHCMLTKTSIYEKIDLPWFALPEYGGTEDMYMCLKAKKAGISIWCDSDIEVGHIGYPPVITSKDAKANGK